MKPGDKIVNIGGRLNQGIKGRVVDVCPGGFPDTFGADVLIEYIGDPKIVKGNDKLYEKNQMYSAARLWKVIEENECGTDW